MWLRKGGCTIAHGESAGPWSKVVAAGHIQESGAEHCSLRPLQHGPDKSSKPAVYPDAVFP